MKSKKIQTWIYGLGLLFVFSAVACEDDIDPLVEEIAYERALTPVGLTARVSNVTTVTLRWTHVYHAEKYSVELHADSMKFEHLVGTYETTASPLVIPDLDGDTQFSIRLKAIGDSTVNDSKWSEVAFMTEIDNILEDFGDSDVWGDQVTFRWPANKSVTSIELTPAEGETISHEFTETEKTEGKATVSGLTAATKYAVIMYNGTQRVGITSFTTLALGTIILTPEDDLAAAVSNASEGAILMLMPGEYSMGEVKIPTSITIQGRNANNKPVIAGNIEIGADVSLSLKDIVLTRGEKSDQGIVYKEAGTSAYLKLDGVTMKNYGKGCLYVNAVVLIDVVEITNCLFHDIVCDGGDLFDFRKGIAKDLIFKYNTVYNCANTARDGFRIDKVSGDLFTGVKPSVRIENNTFYNVSNNKGKRILYIRAADNSIYFNKNILAETAAYYSNQTATNIVSLEENNYFNAPNFMSSDVDKAQNDTGSSKTLLNPGFADPSNGDFTISEVTLMDKGIGDPRWIK